MLPDTQKYTLSDSANQTYFLSETQWIVANLAALNIVFVTHVGDVVDDPDAVEMWQRADLSMSVLQQPGSGEFLVPYGIAPGNHDLPGTYGSFTYYNDYFPYTRYAGQPWYGGHYPENGNENSYQFFSAGGDDYLFLHLAYNSGGPTADVISWATSVLAAHARRKAILVTHSYLNTDGSQTAEGTAIWNSLVVPNENAVLVICGHNSGEVLRTDVLGGRTVQQVLVDYQSRSNGGDGWLRVVKFAPSEGLVHMETYSPALDLYEVDANSKFALEFPMTGAREIGKALGVPSGGAASVVWPGLEEETRYEWFVRIANSLGRIQVGPTWTFRTGTGDTTPPAISDVRAVDVADHAARIIWTTDELASSLVEYGLDENYGSSAPGEGFATSHSVVLGGLSPGGTYHYRVVSADAAGNSASTGDATFTTAPDVTPPAAPAGLAATAGDGQVALDWADNSEPDLAGYNVYRATSQGGPYELLNQTPLAASEHLDASVGNEIAYYYVVTARDLWGNESRYSSEVSATPSSTAYDAYVNAPPTVTYGSVSGGIEGTFAAGDGLVQAIAEVANGSGGMASLDVVYALHTLANPGELSGLELYVSAAWTSLDANDPLVVRIWNGGEWEDITAEAADGIFVPTADPGGYVDSSGSIRVRFSDTAPIRRERKDTLTVDLLYAHVIAGPPDTVPPQAPAGLVAAPDSQSLVVDLVWTGNSEPDLAGYKVYRSAVSGEGYVLVSPALVSGTSYADSVGMPGTYYYVVTAVDGAGNESAPSNEASAVLEDLAPSAPSGLSATAGDGSVSLDWADNPEPDIAGYNVYRSETPGGPYAKLNSSLLTASAFVDEGVTNGTTYHYAVTAVDQADQESPYSLEVDATPSASPASSLHVESIAFGPFIPTGKNWKAQAAVLVHDQGDQPVPGATVVADWLLNGAVLQIGATGLTASDGKALFVSPAAKAKSGDTFTLRVTDVILAGYTYDPSGVTSASAEK